MSLFQNLIAQGGRAFFVADGGTGSGFTAADPMSTADLELATIPNNSRIYFNAADSFVVGDITITSSNIRISRYGTGADPILRGSDDISGLTWTAEGGGVYSAPMAAEPNWIWINGLCAKMAESPRIPIVSRPSVTEIVVTHANVSGYTSIIGSYLVAKEAPFKNSRLATVTAYDGAGEITVDISVPVGSAGAPNVDLVLLNSQEYFVGNNEWVWTAGTLYVKAAASPSTLNIRAGAYDYAFKSSGSLTVDNIEFAEYFTTSVWMNGGIPNIQNCSFHDNRDLAVFIQEAVTGAIVSNNTLSRIGNNGIFTRSCSTSNFNDNTITDIGMQDNYGWQTWISENLANVLSQNNGTAIVNVLHADTLTTNGTGCVYERNVITNTAYNGIHQGTGTEPVIRYNILTNCLNRFIDGGAIYTYHYKATNLPIENADISYNIIDNQKYTAQTVGIYCDARTRAAHVHHNTVKNCYWGILLNLDTESHNVEFNNVYNCDKGVNYLQYVIGDEFYTQNINNQFNNNIIAATRTNTFCVNFQTNPADAGWNPFSGTGGANNNTYIKNASPSALDIATNNVPGTETPLTLAELQTQFGEDAASVTLVENPVLFINPTNAVSNEDAESDYEDFAASPVTTYTIDAFYSRILNEINYSNTFVSASTQYFNAGTTADMQFTHTSVFSIALRFKIASNPGSNQVILDNRTAANRGYTVNMLTTGAVQIQLVNTTTTNRYIASGAIDFADNAWHQLLFVWTGSAGKTYVDGILRTMTEGNNLTATIASTDDLNIGRSGAFGQYFDGLLDDVAIWDEDVSSLIVQVYNGGRSIDYRLNMPDNLPLHYWRMGQNPSLIDGYADVGDSASPLNLTNVNSITATTDAT